MRLDHFCKWLQLGYMPKRKEPELKPKEQFKRFMETAKKLEVDESGKEFEKAFRKAVPPKRKRQRAAR